MSTVVTIGNRKFHTGENLKATASQGLVVNTGDNSIHSTLLGDFKPDWLNTGGNRIVSICLASATSYGGFDLYLLAVEDNVILNPENIDFLEQQGLVVSKFYRVKDNDSKQCVSLGVIGDFALFATERKSSILKPLVGGIYDTVMSMICFETNQQGCSMVLTDSKLHDVKEGY